MTTTTSALEAVDVAARAAGLTLTEPFAHPRWRRALELLATFNAQTNLVGAADPTSVCTNHLLEAVALASALRGEGGRLGHAVDVGAGAGLEALALAWCRDELAITALEPRRKRAGFIRLAADALGLAGRLRVEQRTLAAYCKTDPTPCDLATSRAVFPPGRWLAEASALGPRLVAAHASAATRDRFWTDAARADGWQRRASVAVAGRADRVVLLFGREHA